MFNLNRNYNSINIIFALCLLQCLLLLAKGTEAGKLSPPAADFNKHRLVQPVVHHGRTKRAIISTRDTSGAHHSEVTMKVPIDDVEFILDLQLNKDLITDNHVLRYQEGGQAVTHKPKKEDIDLCQYSGRVRGKPGSWVAVSTCHGVRGVIFDGEETRYIEPAEGDEIQSQHYVYDHSDLNSLHRGHHRVTNYTGQDPLQLGDHAEGRQHNRFKRSTGARVRGPYNANEKSRYVELVLVADNRMYVASGGDLPAVYHKLKDIANIVNSVYAPLNIFVALVGVEVWTQSDKIAISRDSQKTLDNFLQYRRYELSLPNDNAQFLTQQRFDEDVIGKGYKHSMCMHNSGGINTNHSSLTGMVAITMAHEMGHNFGMDHDVGDCECPNKKLCIMNHQLSSVMPTLWSTCSLTSLAHSYEKGLDYCLRNKPKRLFDSPTCGNGFVEPGEQCDCGSSAEPGGANPCHACCQPDTCMLRANATCGAGACCDLQTCRPRAAGAECRAAERECDLPEYCTGHSEFCPDDVYKMDATPCGKDKYLAYCVRGSCRSHASQCQLLWGPSGEPAHKKCYTDKNVAGSGYGNCGYDYQQRRLRACSPQDALCGSLQCQHLGPRSALKIWNIILQYSIQGDSLHYCSAAALDTKPSNEHFVMVPDGAICGHEMMCMQQRCVSVGAVRGDIAAGDSSVCPSNCSGHGVCNSLGNCHCERGFAPPLCTLPGPDSSYDSGPATEPTSTVRKTIMVQIYVIFFAIIPAIFLIFLICYYRRDLTLWWKRPRRSCGDVLSCGGCWTFTGDMKRTIVNSFQYPSGSIRQLFTFKSNAAKTYNTDRVSKNVNSTTKVSNIKIEIIRNVTKTDGSSPTNKLNSPIRMFNKSDIHLVTGTDDEHNIYANLQNMNEKRDNNQKIIDKLINKADTQINGNVDTTSYTSVKPKSVTRYDIDIPHGSKDNTKPIIVNTPIKVINNTNTQIVSDLIKASQVRLRPTPKPASSKGNKPTADNIDSTIQGNAQNLNTIRDNKQKIIDKPIHKTNTQINSNVDTTSYTSVKPQSVTRYDIDIPHGPKDNTKPVIVNTPIKVINNTNTQIVSDLIKASQVRLRPTPKPASSKGNKPTADNIDSTIQGNAQNLNTIRDNKQKIIDKPIHKTNTQINSNVDTTTYTSVKPQSVTRYDIDIDHGSKDNTKPIIVNTPIKVINNTNTQIVSDLIKASQVRLRPTPKPVSSKGKKLTAENLESTIQGNVSDIRRMFDTGNDVPCAQNSNVKVHGVKKLQTARFGLK